MLNVEIVPATQQHIELIIPRVRQRDIDEFQASNGWTARQVLECGLKISTVVCAGLINGEVVTVFGVAPASMLGGAGCPWLVGTDALAKNQKAFLRRCRHIVAAMLAIYPRLENYVDARNHVAKAWLHWLGFSLDDPAPYGVQGLPFHRFHLEKK
ncbi:hypothetical protein EW367_22445 [Salmonella enterica subsp. enterica serovar Fufu]|nr:hypothetical protein [Salmonella enterica subsp. enterica serovar Fufu]